MNKKHRTFAQIDLSAIRANGIRIRNAFAGKKILSVLKADAYGHGIEKVLPAYETFSDWYAVATVEEGLAVRDGSDKPILLFGPIPESKMVQAAQSRLTFTVGDWDYACRLNKEMERKSLTAECHLKIDTGLNRSGIRWRDSGSIEAIRKIFTLNHLDFTGTYTHFACGEGTELWETEFTELQYQRYQDACKAMEVAGLSVGLRHCCSTGGSIVHPEYQMDMVRLGMMPLGMSFSPESVKQYELQPALQWISYVSQIKCIDTGEAVSYGCTFKADKPMRIGLVTCGYADGYHRSYSNRSQVLVSGKRVNVLGRIAMDYLVVDLTEIDGAAPGMQVILLGRDVNGEEISALDLSSWSDSVCGEVTCSISKRVPRIYINP